LLSTLKFHIYASVFGGARQRGVIVLYDDLAAASFKARSNHRSSFSLRVYNLYGGLRVESLEGLEVVSMTIWVSKKVIGLSPCLDHCSS